MKKIILYIIATFGTFAGFGQSSVDSVLAKIERNNTSLSVLRKNLEADKIGNKTGIWPSNPEIEFNYLWGNPSAIGNRTDIAVNQSFDFPVAYKYRSQISEYKNGQAGLEYQRQFLEIIHQARQLCGELTYQNALIAEYNKRVHHARQIAGVYREKLEAGEVNMLDFNKAHVYLLNISKELETIEIERTALLAELAKLNGGNPVAFSDSVFAMPQIISGFEQWYALAEQTNPLLQWLKQELAITHKQKQLLAAQSLPKFSAGYMSEKVVGEQFQGVSLGISIPLWENKNTVKYAKMKTLAVEELQADAKLQFYNGMKAQHAKLVELLSSINSYYKSLLQFDNRELIKKALEKGEISLGEYYIELTLYYESIEKLLKMERSANFAWFELLKYETSK